MIGFEFLWDLIVLVDIGTRGIVNVRFRKTKYVTHN